MDTQEQTPYKKSNLEKPGIEVKLSKDQKYSVFATRGFLPDETLEECVALKFNTIQGFNPVLKNISFQLDANQGIVALGYSSSCKTSSAPNASFCFDQNFLHLAKLVAAFPITA